MINRNTVCLITASTRVWLIDQWLANDPLTRGGGANCSWCFSDTKECVD